MHNIELQIDIHEDNKPNSNDQIEKQTLNQRLQMVWLYHAYHLIGIVPAGKLISTLLAYTYMIICNIFFS